MRPTHREKLRTFHSHSVGHRRLSGDLIVILKLMRNMSMTGSPPCAFDGDPTMLIIAWCTAENVAYAQPYLGYIVLLHGENLYSAFPSTIYHSLLPNSLLVSKDRILVATATFLLLSAIPDKILRSTPNVTWKSKNENFALERWWDNEAHFRKKLKYRFTQQPLVV